MTTPEADDRLRGEGMPEESQARLPAPEEHLLRLGLEIGETPWYRSLIQGIRDTLFPPSSRLSK